MNLGDLGHPGDHFWRNEILYCWSYLMEMSMRITANNQLKYRNFRTLTALSVVGGLNLSIIDDPQNHGHFST